MGTALWPLDSAEFWSSVKDDLQDLQRKDSGVSSRFDIEHQHDEALSRMPRQMLRLQRAWVAHRRMSPTRRMRWLRWHWVSSERARPVKIKVIVDNRLRMHSDDIPGEMLESLREQFTHSNPTWNRLKGMGKYPPASEPEKYVMWQSSGPDDEEFSLPRGGLPKLRGAFDEHGLDYELVDHRSLGAPHLLGSYVDTWQIGCDLFPEHKLVAWDHQREMVEAANKYGQILMRAPTGSGKTSAIIKHIAEKQAPALIIMWDSGLLTETWQPRIEQELGIPVKDQGLIRGSTFKLKPITLAMQQTLARWGEEKWERLFYENAANGLTQCVFHSVYCDEVQRYAARTFVDFVNRFDCHDRIGVTADERRKDRKTFIIYDMFGPVKHEVSKKELVKKRIIHDVECYVVPTEFRADWYVQLKEDGLFDPMIHTRQLLDEMAVDAERNELAVHLIEQCVQAGLPTLSFTQWVDHARRIDAALTGRGIASGLALGGKEWEQVFKETLQQLRDGQLQVGCGTFGKLGVGHDIPAVAAGLAVTPIHNNKGFLGQVKGRICRTTAGKENARIIVMWDRMVYGPGPLHNLRAWNEVCNVWNEWDKRWQDVSEYLKEIENGRTGTTTTAANEDGLFVNVNAGGNTPKRRRS